MPSAPLVDGDSVAGQGSRPFATAYASTSSRASSSNCCVLEKLRVSTCAESVNIRLPSSNPTIRRTIASSVSVNPAERRCCLVRTDGKEAIVEASASRFLLECRITIPVLAAVEVIAEVDIGPREVGQTVSRHAHQRPDVTWQAAT